MRSRLIAVVSTFCMATSAYAQTFNDVPKNNWAYRHVEVVSANGITAGCGGGNYCPLSQVTRAQMAVFLERGMRGSDFRPPAAKGNVFLDVGATDFAASYIEQLYLDGITAGCGGGKYCPGATVSRAEMAVFLLRSKRGSAYRPPAATGMFADVPLSHWAVHWIEQLAREGITGGCGGGNFCPDAVVTRDQMAVFLVRTFIGPIPRYSATEITQPATDILGCEASFASDVYARRLNQNGDAVGLSSCWIATGNVDAPFLNRGMRAFAWTKRTGSFALPALVDSANETYARDINDLGEIVGWETGRTSGGTYYFAPRWTLGGGVSDALALPPECEPASAALLWAESINNAGSIAGRCSNRSTGGRFWVYQKSTGEQTIGPAGFNVLAINDVEVVVGVDEGGRAARWSPVTNVLEVLASAGSPWYINDRNETVGHVRVDNAAPCVGTSTWRPAIWGTDGAQALLRTLPNAVYGVAFGINNDSVAVGMVETPATIPCEAGVETIERAVLWRGQAVFQLDTLVEADPALHLISATSINDAGEILAHGYVDDEPLRPCPGYVSDPGDPSAGQVYNPDLMCRNRRSFLLRSLVQ